MKLSALRQYAVIAGLLAVATPAFAQAPSRIDNIWNHRDHEPDAASVRQREKADGLLPPGTAQRENRATNQIARELLQGEPTTAPAR